MTQSGLIAELDLPSVDTSHDLVVIDSIWPKIGLTKIDNLSNSNVITSRYKIKDHNDEQSLIDIQSKIALFAMENLRSEIAIHAAAMRFEENFVAFPGRSMSGKSQLMKTANAMRDRFDVEILCDEYVLVKANTLEARNYPRRIHLRSPEGFKEVTNIQTKSVRFEITHLLFTEYRDERDMEIARFASLDEGKAANLLMQTVIQAASNPHDTFSTCVQLSRSTNALSAKRGEAEPFLAQLFEYLSH